MSQVKSKRTQDRLRWSFLKNVVHLLILLVVVQGWTFWEPSQGHQRFQGTSALERVLCTLRGSTAEAAEVSVFGPKKYIRTTGKPNIYTDRFSAQAGKGTVVIVNGEADGSHRVSSAIITLNGRNILKTKDFNQNVYHLRVVVDLAALNTLVVELRSKPGSFLTIEILAERQNNPPVADAGPDQAVDVSQTVTLDGSASSDMDGDPLTYNWSFTSIPLESTATLSDPTAISLTFVVDKPGSYVAQLIVNDGKTDSTPATVTITALKPVPPIYPSEVTSFVRPSDAAYLVVQTSRGDTVTLELPKGAFGRAQHVTVKVLETLPSSPFHTSALLPGVAIEPDGIELLRGARLQIDLTSSLLHPLATAIAWIRGTNDATLIANPSSGDKKVEGNLRHFSAYQPVDLVAAAAAGELTLVVPSTSQDYSGLMDAAVDAQSKAKLARAFCAGLGSCTLGDPAAHDARAISLFETGIEDLLDDTNPSDPCGSYLADLYEAMNAIANIVGADDLAEALRDRIRDLEAQCCAPNTCSPVCPSCPDQGHWTIRWNKSGMGSHTHTWQTSEIGECVQSWSETGSGFAEVQYGTGYVSAFSMTGTRNEEQKTTRTFLGCPSGGSITWDKRSYTLTESGISQAESILSGLFGSQQGRVSYIMNPFFSTTSLEAGISGEFHQEESTVDCDGKPYSSTVTIPYSGTCPCYYPGIDGGIFPVDAEGLIYFYTVTQERLTGCWVPGVYFPITYDFEAAWTDASSQGPRPPSCRGVTCQPGDQCHDPGVCNPATGTCSPPKVLVGASCGGDYCTAAGTCDAQGACVPGNPFNYCPEPDPQCPGVECNPTDGECIYAADGNTCNDGNVCTTDDKCFMGKCQGTDKSCAHIEQDCWTTPQCGEWSGECYNMPKVKGERCKSNSVCWECDGKGECKPLSQATLDMSCDTLIWDTIAICQGLKNDTWRVDASISTAEGGTINYVACAETGGSLVNVNNWSGNICSHAGAGERQTDFYCRGAVTSISAAADTQCARAKDTTQGQCEAICTACVQ